jgi:hypothetical protein
MHIMRKQNVFNRQGAKTNFGSWIRKNSVALLTFCNFSYGTVRGELGGFFSLSGWIVLGAAALVAIVDAPAAAQTNRNWLPTGTADYDSSTNWSEGFVPDATFDERAAINNGGTAVVSTSVVAPSAVLLGQAAGNSGTLEIANSGTLPVDQLAGNQGLGTVTVGAAGTGVLRVLPGGTLSADGALTSGANAANMIVLGGTAAGAATVNVGSATFGGTTQAFRGVDFNSAGAITFQPSSQYNVTITAAGGPVLRSMLTTTLDGALNVNFSGVAPTVGNTWDLFDASAVSGSFDSILVSGAAPGPGQRYAVRSLPAPANRARGVLAFEQFLQLNVDRNTGAVSISNAGGQAFEIQGYSIASAAGSLSAGQWNSLDDQNALGGDWRESNPSANRLSELKPTGAGTLAGAGSASLGTAFVPNPAAFGTPTEDLTFQYSTPGGGLATGVVNYTGAPRPNNLLLSVDPASGAAQLTNTSPHSVTVDGYSITSASNSLSVAGWNSLDDQNAAGGDWRESNPRAGRLSELKPTNAVTLASDASFDLGNLFLVGGMQDLAFAFSIANQGLVSGVVAYGAITTGVPGDYNSNGIVDAADFVVWRNSVDSTTLVNRGPGIVGPVGESDYDFWRSRFGATAGSGTALASTAVPEPNMCWLAALAALCVAAKRISRSLTGTGRGVLNIESVEASGRSNFERHFIVREEN